MSRPGHYEVVQTDAEQPWLARYVAANGEQVWRTSENYADRKAALEAIEMINGHGVEFGTENVEVLLVDERTQK